MRICNQIKIEHDTSVKPMYIRQVWKYILFQIQKIMNFHQICKLGHFS